MTRGQSTSPVCKHCMHGQKVYTKWFTEFLDAKKWLCACTQAFVLPKDTCERFAPRPACLPDFSAQRFAAAQTDARTVFAYLRAHK